jgi:cytochrome c553
MRGKLSRGVVGAVYDRAPLALIVALLLALVPMAMPVAAQRGATRPQVLLPDGPVRQIIRKNCTACHGIDGYAFYALDKAGWQKLIETKHKNYEVPIPAQDLSPLLDWFESKFGPTTKPFPRTYIAPEITTFFSDPEAKRLLDRACATCHDLEKVNKLRRTQEGWRVLSVDMRERGAKLTDEELEQLVEWLGRVQGTNQDQ